MCAFDQRTVPLSGCAFLNQHLLWCYTFPCLVYSNGATEMQSRFTVQCGNSGLRGQHIWLEFRERGWAKLVLNFHIWLQSQGSTRGKVLPVRVSVFPKVHMETLSWSMWEARKEPLRGWCILRIPQEPSVKRASVKHMEGKRQVDFCDFKASFIYFWVWNSQGYLVRPCLKTNQKQTLSTVLDGWKGMTASPPKAIWEIHS